MSSMVLLIIVVTMSLLKATLDSSWLNKLISLISLGITLPILMVEMASLLKIEIFEEYIVVMMIIEGMIFMTILRDVYSQIRHINTSIIEN